jgi:hypothetical protein
MFPEQKDFPKWVPSDYEADSFEPQFSGKKTQTHSNTQTNITHTQIVKIMLFLIGKLLLVSKMLQEIRKQESDRVVLVSHSTKTLDVFEKMLNSFEVSKNKQTKCKHTSKQINESK